MNKSPEKREEILQIKTTTTEKESAKKIADRYFGGNMSDMARFAIFNWDWRENPPPKM